ncbi:GGDEF domain-containing protein [Mesorhizobium microcysteis]|uniref:diguanylate cyclase n=1 Tax=Neoaquamicrobium microcysteis TaxID=2682781 RepID=A0A5D4H770_9HYPH|nr:GGDEF domain-containing protein [Mesorhizobium microcysteis]
MVAFPSRGVLKKSAIVTIICAAISISVSTGIRFYLGVQSDTITIIVRLILPFIIAFPIAIMLFAKIEKLEKAYRSLLKEARELAKCASTDPLTGLLNRRSFERQFNLAMAHRAGGKFIIADMDYLKAINDEHGHLVGDDAIISFAQALELVLGDECLIARIGGDEFCAYLPKADANTVNQLVTQVGSAARNEFLRKTGLDYPLSFSVGMQKCHPKLTFREMISRADNELYAKKRSRSAPTAIDKAA